TLSLHDALPISHPLDGEIDGADQNVGSRIDANVVRNACIEVQLCGDAVDFEEDSVDAEIWNVEDDIVLGIFVRTSSSTSHLLRSGDCASCSALSRQAIGAQGSIESARGI